ncbi:hypothetical protein Tco_0471851 [Tanacetum coccineum]
MLCKSTSTSGVSPDVAELKDMVRALLLDKQTSPILVPAPAPVKAIEQSCVTAVVPLISICGRLPLMPIPRGQLILGKTIFMNGKELDLMFRGRDDLKRNDVKSVHFSKFLRSIRQMEIHSLLGNQLLIPFAHPHSFEGSDFILEEIEAELSDTSYKSGIDDAECDPENDILLLEAILNSEPLSPLPNQPMQIYFLEYRNELRFVYNAN